MKVRTHQYIDLFIVALFLIACAQSMILGNSVLDRLSIISMYIVLASIVLGIVIAAYIHFTKDQIFDPLSSELDEDPDDPENR